MGRGGLRLKTAPWWLITHTAALRIFQFLYILKNLKERANRGVRLARASVANPRAKNTPVLLEQEPVLLHFCNLCITRTRRSSLLTPCVLLLRLEAH